MWRLTKKDLGGPLLAVESLSIFVGRFPFPLMLSSGSLNVHSPAFREGHWLLSNLIIEGSVVLFDHAVFEHVFSLGAHAFVPEPLVGCNQAHLKGALVAKADLMKVGFGFCHCD